jgi:adenylosuccinate synthase
MDTARNVTVVVGGQFGSEAKGKVISYLASEFDIAVRTGSPNAGHTVFGDAGEIYRLQQIPATFLNPHCVLCIGAGALIDPDILRREVSQTGTKDRLYIDPQAGIIEKKHHEAESELVKSIGSTGKGCGAALAGRIWRKDFKLASEVLKDGFNISNVSEIINKGIDEGKRIVVEGTQGFGLSLYHGTYPHTTSRDTTAANFLAEAGISPLAVKEIILVIRTFPIRVAGPSGPLPHEISWEDLSARIGKNIIEHTTVTGNVRRVAGFDIDIVKQAVAVNRPTQIALQFLNYLFPEDENKFDWDELTKPAQEYVLKLEEELNVPITLIGTGAGNASMIDRR